MIGAERIARIAPAGVGALRRRPAAADRAFLIAVVALSAALYVGGLGFHGDDWGFFSELSEPRDRSLPGLAAGVHERDIGLRQRPVQLAYVTGAYYLFGLDPLGYHIVGALMLILIALLLYGILRELHQHRAFAVSVPLLYVLLPHYTGARLWFGAHTAVLSIVFLVLSAYALLRALRSQRLFAPWVALGTAAVVASVLSYELTLPVIALMTGAVALRRRGGARRTPGGCRRRTLTAVTAYALALAFSVSFKAAVTTRVGIDEPYLDYLLRIARGSVQVNFGAYGVGIPYVLGWIVVHAPSAKVFAVSALIGIGAAVYLASLAPPAPAVFRAASRRYLVAGLLLFAAGCAIFVIPTLVHFESTGRDNRIAVATALGVAVAYTGFLAAVSSLVSRPGRRRAVFGASSGLLCAAASVITQTQATFWIDAYAKQQEVVSRIASDVPLPDDGALILDGVCLQRGGAWVLTGARDLPALLRLRHGAQRIRGAAISRPVVVDDDGIHVKAFNAVAFFPYEDDLLVYDYHRRTAHRLARRADAEAYFANRQLRPERDCPTVFAWGLEGL